MTWPPWHSIECWAADCDGCGCPCHDDEETEDSDDATP